MSAEPCCEDVIACSVCGQGVCPHDDDYDDCARTPWAGQHVAERGDCPDCLASDLEDHIIERAEAAQKDGQW